MLSCIVPTWSSWSSGVLAVSHRLDLVGVLAVQPCLPRLMILIVGTFLLLRCSFSFSFSSAQLSLSAPLTAYAHSHSCKSTVPYLLKVSTIEICMPCSGRQALLGPRYRHDMLCCNCTALHFCFSAHGRQVHGIPSFLLPRFFLSSSFFRT